MADIETEVLSMLNDRLYKVQQKLLDVKGKEKAAIKLEVEILDQKIRMYRQSIIESLVEDDGSGSGTSNALQRKVQALCIKSRLNQQDQQGYDDAVLHCVLLPES